MIPNGFPRTNWRQAFGRDWLWPASDQKGWAIPLAEWVDLEVLIKSVTTNGKFGVVVQAGGCCGMYPWLLLQYADLVYTFEPDQHNFYCLVNNCASPRVIAANAALGNSDHPVNLRHPSDQNCGMPFVQWNERGIIPSYTIDSLHLSRMDALILDAEASETAIIMGAANSIKHHQPRIITCETITDLMVEYLRVLGYALQPKGGRDRWFLPTEGAIECPLGEAMVGMTK